MLSRLITPLPALVLASCAQAPLKLTDQATESPAVQVAPAVVKAPAFSAKSGLAWVAELSDTLNCVIGNEAFLAEVEAFPKFTHTTATPKQVADSLRSMSGKIVSTYKARLGSKVIATTYKGDRTTLYLNLRKNPRAVAYMVNTCVHEALHLEGYSHGDNSPKGKADSINYRVGAMAEKYAELCNKSIVQTTK